MKVTKNYLKHVIKEELENEGILGFGGKKEAQPIDSQTAFDKFVKEAGISKNLLDLMTKGREITSADIDAVNVRLAKAYQLLTGKTHTNL